MSQKVKDPHLASKVSKMKERQDNWMKERDASNTPSKKFIHSSLRSSGTLGTKPKSRMVQQDSKKTEAMVWTTNSNYNGFVVRNGSGTSRSKKDSARTPSTTKTKSYTHSSLKEPTPSRPTTAKSSNFIESKQKKLEYAQDEVENNINTSDESLSTSFTEHMANLQLSNLYNSNKYDSTTSQDQKTSKRIFLANHFCSLCKDVMLSVEKKPQIVFPCGHTFCARCLIRKRKCPECEIDIISTQTNEALYMVIQEFKKKTDIEELERKENQIRNYIDEYKNLQTRINIMKGWCTTFKNNLFSSKFRVFGGAFSDWFYQF